jgi:hypothetical protein
MGASLSTQQRGVGSRRRAGVRRLAVVGGLALGLGIVPQALAVPIAPTFGAATGSPFSAGTRPSGLALANLNAGASLDLAIADEGNGSSSSVMTALAGNGAGGLSALSTRAVGIRPEAIAAGTFDAGATVDLAVVNYGSDTVSILRGNGDGTFQTALTENVGDRPLAIAAGDVDNDGDTDLAVANSNDDELSILLNNGSANFSEVSTPNTGDTPSGVALVHLNADANLDMVAANEDSNSVTIRLGSGDGNFGSSSTVSVGNDPYGIAAGDLNHDGKQDVVVANEGANTVSILLGNGSGGLTAQASPPSTGSSSAPRAVAIGNMNGDGDPDIVTANVDNDRVSVLPGNGNGTFGTRVDLTAGNEPSALALGDLNGDGRTDIVAANTAANTVSVFLNTTAATISVAGPATLAFPATPVGASAGPLSAPVTVVSNAAGGYQMSIGRTAFTRGDIPLSVSAASAPAGALLDLSPGVPAAVPTAGTQNVGHRANTTSLPGGDVWGLAFHLGPVPLVLDGAHSSTVTYTVVGLP